jgi:hypothetical protein
MIEMKIERADVNVELLDAQLRAAAGEHFYGLSLQRGAVLLYLSDAISPDTQQTLGRIARQHDATQVTPKQQAEAERKIALEQGRTRVPIDEKQYEGSPALIQALAAKIAWLEQEIRDLRGVS